MPHRTTYFFPRQFPDYHHNRGFDASASKQQLSDHEKKISPTAASTATTITTSSGGSIAARKFNAFNPESDHKSLSKTAKDVSFSEFAPISDLFTGEAVPLSSDFTVKHQTKKQLSALRHWFVAQKGEKEKSSPLLHVKPRLSSTCDGDREPLLRPSEPSPAPEPDQVFDRQVSLPRVSSWSSYAGSLFSGTTTTVDGNFSSGVKDSSLSTLASTKQEEEVKKVSLAQRTREGYLLQLGLAKRLASEASLSIELQPHLQRDVADESYSDVEAVSHRLWVGTSPSMDPMCLERDICIVVSWDWKFCFSRSFCVISTSIIALLSYRGVLVIVLPGKRFFLSDLFFTY